MSKETVKESTFDVLNKISVKGKTDIKGRFTYLSWVYAWSELKKVDSNATTKVYHNEVTNLPYFGAGKAGIMVKVGVTVKGIEHINYLPAMDFKNKAIPEENITMMDVNKAIQRSTVKAIALHGLGLYIYAGEDLPEEEAKKDSPVKTKAKKEEKKEAKGSEEKKSGNSFRNSKKADAPAAESKAAKAPVVEDDEEL